MTWIVAAGVLGAIAGLAGAALMLARARRGGLPVDVPDDRRLHTTPTPRGGGLGLPVAGLLAVPIGWAAADTAIDRRLLLVVALAWALPNGLLGFIDDFRPLRSRVKFGLQIACAVLAVALGLRLETISLPPFGPLDLGPAAWPISVLWLVWLANVYNFMDGMDALAAGSGALFFAGFACFAGGAGLFGMTALAVAMAGASLGFLGYNRPPARIFMGDGGSLFVGAAQGGLALALARLDTAGVSIAASIVLMGTFVWDATFTIARRALRGEPMLPHRTHLYQRLVLAGWTHGRVRALYFGLAALFAAGAVAMTRAPRSARAAIVGLALAASLGLVWLVARAERART